MINAILKLIVARIVVRTEIVPQMVDYLEAELTKHGLEHTRKIPRDVALVFVEEALRRAEEVEKDGRARYGRFNKQVELVAGEIIRAFRGDSHADQRVRSILVFHNLL